MTDGYEVDCEALIDVWRWRGSASAIAKALGDDGHRMLNGVAWDSDSVSRVLERKDAGVDCHIETQEWTVGQC